MYSSITNELRPEFIDFNAVCYSTFTNHDYQTEINIIYTKMV